MKILFVAMENSIHTARWISQIGDKNWDLYLFPGLEVLSPHPGLKKITIYRSGFGKQVIGANGCKSSEISFSSKLVWFIKRKLIKDEYEYRVKKLINIINRVKPDVIHSLEFQASGYLTLEAKKKINGKFPVWIATNWGSDIFLFGRLSRHESKIRELLAECDFYSCECKRDAYLARQYGFKKDILPVFPNTGGLDVEALKQLRTPGPTSDRKIIMLKGYQGWAGRALVGLRALERCAELLSSYEIIIFSPVDEVVIAAELFSKSTGIPIKVIPRETPQRDILRLHGQARISLGLSISDGISTSFLEAMAMGSFPIQTFTACADEWITDGRTGILVHPDDPEIVESAIRRALEDDDLVNKASEENLLVVKERLDEAVIKPKVVEFYNTVARKRGLEDGK